jgi:phosphonatase-like hydrolase
MAFKLAVFDMAGTTVADRDAVALSFVSAFRKKGITVATDEVKPLMGYKKTVAIETVLKDKSVNYTASTIDEIHEDFVSEMVSYYKESDEVKPLPGAEDLFRYLHDRGIIIALNTGFPRIIADTIVDRLGWKKDLLIDDYIASDEVEKGRPEPFMINELMSRSGVTDPEEVVKVGDTEVDINEGRNAGCGLVVAVTTGAFTRAQLEPYHPDQIVDNLKILESLIH